MRSKHLPKKIVFRTPPPVASFIPNISVKGLQPIPYNPIPTRRLQTLVTKGSHFRKADAATAPKVLFVLLSILFSVILIGIGSTIFTVIGYAAKINGSLPDPGKIVTQSLAQSTQIYDRNGKLLYTAYRDENRQYVSLSQIPQQTQWALLAAEDIDFYQHKGIDVPSIMEAILQYLTGQEARGASTITQQLARNVVLQKLYGDAAYDRTLQRKLTEILTAFQIEEKLTKQQILEIQMNEVFLGGTTYGYETAARTYFNKDVSQLSLSESALLAGIIQSPTFYLNEYKNGDAALVKKRRDDILDLMLKHSDKTGVTAAQIAAAKNTPLTILSERSTITAPHFVFYVLQQLEQMYGPDAVYSGGLQVTTTLDLSAQKVAERRLKQNINNFKTWYGVHNGAVIIIDPRNGEILAMVGSVDYNNTKDKRVDGNVNVTIMPRQMGSSVKPYTYMAAFLSGYTPASIVPDLPLKFGGYKPSDWDGRYYGMLTIRTALNQSRNIPAVYTLSKIGGAPRFIKEAQKLGITTLTNPNQYGLSITLGAAEMTLLEHTNAYGAFANEGVMYTPSSILQVKDSTGKVIYKLDPTKTRRRVYTEDQAYMMNWILCQMGGRLDKAVPFFYQVSGQKICGKTGTTTGPKDLVTIGYYPKLLVGVWTGNNNGQLTWGTRGQGWSENVPIVIMHDIMTDLIPKYGYDFYSQPNGIVNTTACTKTKNASKCTTNSSIKFR